MLAVLALMASPAAFAAYTVQHTQTGAIVRAGPSASGSSQGPGGFSGGPPGGVSNRFGPPPNGSGNPPSPPSGSNSAAGRFGPDSFAPPSSTNGSQARPGNGAFGGQGPGGGQVNTALINYLVKHRGTAKYLIAVPSSNEAASIIIASGDPVMSLGGFTGSDPILTPAKLASLAKQGVVRYFLISGGGFGGPGGGSSSLTTWIQQHSRLITVGGTQLYEYTG
jgi:hypothetical protein